MVTSLIPGRSEEDDARRSADTAEACALNERLKPLSAVVGRTNGLDRAFSGAGQNAMLRLSRQVMALLELRRLSARMANTLETMESMRGLLLVCFVCQRVRDDQGHWLPPEAFLRRNLDASVSAGICPDCFGKENWHVE